MNQIFNNDNDRLIIKSELYEGPFDTLLDLIHESKLSILEIKLADLTDAFINYISTKEYVSLKQKGEFLTVASEMLKFKSIELLPRDNSEIEVGDIEETSFSKEQEYKEILMRLDYLRCLKETVQPLEETGRIYREPVYSEKEFNVVLKDFNYDKLIEAYVNVMHRIVVTEKNVDTKEIEAEKFSVAGQIDMIVNRLKKDKVVSLYGMFVDCVGRSELICTFLALLELAKREFLLLDQNVDTGDIQLILHNSEALEGDEYVEDEYN